MDVRISDYLIGIIMFTMIISSGLYLIVEFGGTNTSFVDQEKFSKFDKSFNKTKDILLETDSLKSGVQNSDTDFGAFGVLDSLISSAWQVLKVMFTSLTFMDAVWSGLYTIFGVPPFVGALIGSLIVIVIVFTIYGAIFRKET